MTTQSRAGSITIAGKTVYITQCGYKLSIDPAIAEVGSNAGAGRGRPGRLDPAAREVAVPSS